MNAIIKKVHEIMKDLDVLVFNNWEINRLSDISNDFSLVEKIIKKPSDIQRRFSPDKRFDCFTWITLNDPSKYNSYLLYNDKLHRDDYELFRFMCNNTVILYKNNEFIYDENIKHVKEMPRIADFTASKYLLNSIPIDYHNNMKSELILSFEKNINSSLKDENLCLIKNTNTRPISISIPSFEEEYNNIRPMTIDGDDIYNNISMLLTSDKLTKKDENNQCQSCGCCLFGEFYAVELKTNNHICLCLSCTHSESFDCMVVQKLRVMDEIPILLTIEHEVSYIDKINRLQVSDEVKQYISDLVHWEFFGDDINNLNTDKYKHIETNDLVSMLIDDIKIDKKIVWIL